MSLRFFTYAGKATFFFALLAGLVFFLSQSFRGLSPAGHLVSPSGTIWQHESGEDSSALKAGLAAALQQSSLEAVDLTIDENGVPHLTAPSDASLFFAQGYITAYYRLWQMDFLSRITAGRLAELVGPSATPVDRFFRRMRVPQVAQASLEIMLRDTVTKVPLEAFSRGVNARILSLRPELLPLEYQIFGVRPENWGPIRAAHLLKFMTWQLTGYLFDFRMTETKKKLTPEMFDLLFPTKTEVTSPIIRTNSSKAKSTANKNSPLAMRPETLAHWVPSNRAELNELGPEIGNGSNNWAVPAHRMLNRRSLVANDLHLGYSLPALWFPIQLTSPTMNVYGASLPGAPGVIVGFNDDMGWAVTNGTDDVLDWYSLRYRDSARKEYYFDKTWRPIVTQEDIIHVAHQPDQKIVLRESHVGPILFESSDEPGISDIPAGLAMKWTGSIPSNELKTFLLLNRAKEARDCFHALENYIAPSQNFVCTDGKGRIAYMHAGQFPDRGGKDGRIVREATTSEDLWRGMLPASQTPRFETSAETIVSANQAPIAGSNLSSFGWFFTPPFRAVQINRLLESRKKWQPEEMIGLQGDVVSLSALRFKDIALLELNAPMALAQVQSEIAQHHCTEKDFISSLATWNGGHTPVDAIAPLVNEWAQALSDQTWTRVIGTEDRFFWPNRWHLYDLMQSNLSPGSSLWDRQETPQIESLRDQLISAFQAACHRLSRAAGESAIQWKDYQNTTLAHVAKLPGLGRTRIPAGGIADSIYANKGHHGPTWKMIVALESPPRAWTMIPGGQSGDPTSNSYDDKVSAWGETKMQPVHFFGRGDSRKKGAHK